MSSDLLPLAESLGVTVESLDALGVARADSAWIIPERDADGQIIGHAKRFDSGSKGFIAGGKRGLTLAWPLDAYAGSSDADPIVIVEGMSDCAAAMDIGFSAIGRPSATGGVDLLAMLLEWRHVLVVGENDSGAGKAGAEKVARGLVHVASSVRVIYPPADTKDLRAWKNATWGCTRDEVMSFAKAAETKMSKIARIRHLENVIHEAAIELSELTEGNASTKRVS